MSKATSITGWAVFNNMGLPSIGSVRQYRRESIKWFVGSFLSQSEIDRAWRLRRKRGFTCRRVAVTELTDD